MSSRAFGEVKWFGGYNSQRGCENDFGFIRPQEAVGTNDVKVLLKDLECQPYEMQEGAAVSFVLDKRPRTPHARRVRRLEKETCKELLLRAAMDLRTKPGITALRRLVELGTSSTEEMVGLLNQCEMPERQEFWRIQRAVPKYLWLASPIAEWCRAEDLATSVMHALDEDYWDNDHLVQVLAGVWESLSTSTRASVLFWFAKAGHSDLLPEDDDPLFIMLRRLLKAPVILRHDAFVEFHGSIIEYVVERVTQPDLPIDLDPLLPTCHLHPQFPVKYCEGRPWHTEDERERGEQRASRAWCPRLGHHGRQAPVCTADPLYGKARIYPKQDESSLLEILDHLGVRPDFPGVSDKPGEYVNTLAGWVNRLREIQKRMHCSVCNAVMVPDGEYSRNFARYNVTIAYCPNGHAQPVNRTAHLPDQEKVYLNHCRGRGCGRLIDSRESSVRVDGYYLCIHCGTGRDGHRPGSVCPNCGSRSTQRGEDHRRVSCNNCGHHFRTPRV